MEEEVGKLNEELTKVKQELDMQKKNIAKQPEEKTPWGGDSGAVPEDRAPRGLGSGMGRGGQLNPPGPRRQDGPPTNGSVPMREERRKDEQAKGAVPKQVHFARVEEEKRKPDYWVTDWIGFVDGLACRRWVQEERCTQPNCK